jgi:anti-sigma regulatory factor (Ser/Thr protein kinase)
MGNEPRKPIQLRIFAAEHLPVVRAAVDKAARQAGFDDETAGAVVLSVDEALTNVIRHAYKGAADRPIEVEIEVLNGNGPGGLAIRLRDYGQWVDPETIKSRDLKDVRPGGLGVHIMKECMDSVSFAPADGGGTLLTMIKMLKTKQESNK